MARIEFYIGDAEKYIAAVYGEAVPRPGEVINILKVQYTVDCVKWALDNAGSTQSELRANVELIEVKP